jgi:hypothetical protein
MKYKKMHINKILRHKNKILRNKNKIIRNKNRHYDRMNKFINLAENIGLPPINTNNNDPFKLTKEEFTYVNEMVMCTCCNRIEVSEILCREYFGCKYGEGCYCCSSDYN